MGNGLGLWTGPFGCCVAAVWMRDCDGEEEWRPGGQ